VRKPHQPKRMLEIILSPRAKCDPARIGNPVVLLSQTFCQERIAYENKPPCITRPTLLQLAREMVQNEQPVVTGMGSTWPAESANFHLDVLCTETP
jgi:hypothetical protein